MRRVLNRTYRVPDSAFRDLSSMFRVLNCNHRLPGSAFRVLNCNRRVPSSAFRGLSSIFRGQRCKCRVPGSAFRVLGTTACLQNAPRKDSSATVYIENIENAIARTYSRLPSHSQHPIPYPPPPNPMTPPSNHWCHIAFCLLLGILGQVQSR